MEAFCPRCRHKWSADVTNNDLQSESKNAYQLRDGTPVVLCLTCRGTARLRNVSLSQTL